MFLEQQSQKRPVQTPCAAPPGNNISSVPPKKRPRLPDYEAASSIAAPLDLSAKSTPMTLTNEEDSSYSTPMLTPHQSMMLLTAPGLPAVQDTQWQEAAAAAMYAQYMAAYLNSLMPPPPPPPPLQPPSLPISPSDKETVRLSCGETDFRCSCGRHFANLVGLTVHMRTAGHRSAVPSASASDLPKAMEPPSVARELPKLVRGQDMWINSETEQTREILRCIRCKQSYRTLPELTMHMVRSRHYAEIISSAASATSAPTMTTTSTSSTASLPAKMRQPQQPRDGPAYLCPDLAPAQSLPAPGAGADANPLSCLQRLVDKTAGSSDATAASTAPAVSPSTASTSSTSEAASVIVVATEDQAADEEAVQPASQSPTMPPAKQQQQQQQQQSQKKKIKCQFCSRPFANKGQVRLHVSKGKCPGAGRAAEAQHHHQQQHHHQAPALFEYFLGGAAATRANPVWW